MDDRNRILKCDNVENACESIMSILNINAKQLSKLITSFGSKEKSSFREQLICDYILPESLECIFYHFTSCLSIKSFEKGLLPLHQSYIVVLEDLFTFFGDKVTQEQKNKAVERINQLITHNNLSFSRVKDDDGPNGYFIREFGLTNFEGHTYYLSCSEFLEDFFRYTKDIFDFDLYELFKENKKMVVVSFSKVIHGKEEIAKWLSYAIEYIYHKNYYADISMCNEAFYNLGNPIEQEFIINVEIIGK
ncbi:MAG TPA: hypothetical protein DIW31_07675 [Bacteroidales bacterium]|nr:hypothetical protein [Bacteroidales bacterium]